MDAFDKLQPKKKLPCKKKKGIHDSFRYPQGFKISGNRIFLPKMGWVGFFGKKQRKKVSAIHAKIWMVRTDHLHKASHNISKNHAIIVLEDLKISNMSKSAKGTLEEAGKHVQAKSGLNKSILDQGRYEFRRQLTYKQHWRGGSVLLVSPKNTSITCPCCGLISKENRQTQSEFLCIECGHSDHADRVGALNVLRAGHAQLACGAQAQ
jgi:putative transposase